MKPIKFIYFDVGGVVILDFSKTNKFVEMLLDLGIPKSDHKRFFETFARYSHDIHIGKMDLDQFVKIVQADFELDLPRNYSMLDDFVGRFEANPTITPILKRIVGQYRVGLLTTQYLGMLDKIKERGIFPKIGWDVVVDSSIVGLCKPHDDVFKLAEEMANVEPKNILFVENTIKHIDAAKKRGWQTLLYDPADVFSSNNRLLKMLDL